MGYTFFFEWEVTLIEWLQQWGGPYLTAAMKFFTTFGESVIIVIFLTSVYFVYSKEAGRRVMVVNFINLVANPMMKNVVMRRRPYFDHKEVACLKPVEEDSDLYDISAQGYSFPSGHSSTAASCYAGLAYEIRKPWVTVLAAVVTLLVGVSRFYLGVHYPTDVLAGWALGLILVFCIGILDRRVKRKWILYAAVILLSLPGWFFCVTEDFYTGFGMNLGGYLGFLFEDRFVRFRVTRHPVRAVIRVVIALGLFVGLNALMKLPFPEAVLTGTDFAAHLVRASRYTVCVFLILGVYPLCFRFLDRKEEEKRAAEQENAENCGAGPA